MLESPDHLPVLSGIESLEKLIGKSILIQRLFLEIILSLGVSHKDPLLVLISVALLSLIGCKSDFLLVESCLKVQLLDKPTFILQLRNDVLSLETSLEDRRTTQSVQKRRSLLQRLQLSSLNSSLLIIRKNQILLLSPNLNLPP